MCTYVSLHLRETAHPYVFTSSRISNPPKYWGACMKRKPYYRGLFCRKTKTTSISMAHLKIVTNTIETILHDSNPTSKTVPITHAHVHARARTTFLALSLSLSRHK